MAKKFFDGARSQPPSPNGGTLPLGLHILILLLTYVRTFVRTHVETIGIQPGRVGLSAKLVAKMSKKGVIL